MPITGTPSGGMMITGRGDLPEGGMSFYTLITAYSAARMHVESGGRMKLTRTATPSNLVHVLNQHYPDRPEGPFKGRTMKVLLPQIKAEVERQNALHRASMSDEQRAAFDRILNES